MGRSLHQATRSLEVYIEVLTGFSHVFSPHSLNNTILSQGYVLEMAPTVGRGYSPKVGGDEELPIA